ncbi:hypothetical protein BJ973_009051 [Actinoplanes tereljensis]|uniref:hypothetical protein n=1 Tax=Paractinoplanes tereljensis TaxID=571912 RepID=UPI0019445A29|nr:hypothetical protein [Actinoplanes tereljensis]
MRRRTIIVFTECVAACLIIAATVLRIFAAYGIGVGIGHENALWWFAGAMTLIWYAARIAVWRLDRRASRPE